MNKLVFKNNDQAVTSSVSISENFDKAHRNVTRDIENVKKDVLNFEQMFYETTEPDSYGRPRKIYLMNRDGFTLLAMGFTGAKAMEFKMKYINEFNKMEKFLNSPEMIVQRAMEIQQKKIESLEQENNELKPKALFAEAVETSKSSVLIGELAKILKQNGVDIGQNRLFEWLRSNGFLIKQKGENYNSPTQRSMEQGLLEIKKNTINNPDGSIRTTRTPKVTGKGQIYFVKKFLSDAS